MTSEKEKARVAAIHARQAEEEARNPTKPTSPPADPVLAFNRSTPGKAARAFDRGDQFFQVELSHADVTGSASLIDGGARDASITRKGPAADVLGQIEQAGWKLEHANWVFVQTGQNSRDKFLTTGQQSVVTGEVMGIYLFRRDEERRQRVERPDLAQNPI
jgi:hypothetical protein